MTGPALTDTGWSAIDAVDWRAMVGVFVPGDFDRWLAGEPLPVVEDDLAATVIRSSPDRLAEAVVAGGGAPELAAWLPGAAEAATVFGRLTRELDPTTADQRAVDRQARADGVAYVLATIGTGDGSGPLRIDPRLEQLATLLALAADVGRRHPLGRLVAGVAHLPGAAGVWSGADGVVVIAPDTLRDLGRLAEVWAHELAHALDPAGPGSGRASFFRGELFAHLLGPALLEHRPATVDAAVDLFPTLDNAGPDDGEDLPAVGGSSAVAFRAIVLALQDAARRAVESTEAVA